MSFNKITIVGHLGRDPELSFTTQGTAACKMSVATSEKRKDRNGEQQEFTTWFRVTVWGRQAELCNEYLAKGRQVYIEGRLRQEEYTDREGNQRTSLEVNATDVQFIGSRSDDAGGSNSHSRPPARSSDESRSAAAAAQVANDEDDIPF